MKTISVYLARQQEASTQASPWSHEDNIIEQNDMHKLQRKKQLCKSMGYKKV